MKKIYIGQNSSLPVILLVLVEAFLLTLVVTVWPAYGW